MRAAGALVVLACALAACKGKSDASTGPDPAAIKAQQELIARRDSLLAERQEMQTKSDKLDGEIREIQSKGGDASEKIKQKADLDGKLQSSSTDFNQLSTKIDAIAAQGDQSAMLAQRIEKVAQAEADVAKREAEVGKKLDEIERLVRELDGKCGQAAPALVIQSTGGGSPHSRKDIEPLLAQARKEMAKRGILASDLPASAQGLENEASAAMQHSDWNTAYLAAAQLAGQVQALRIDRNFVNAKYDRLANRVKAMKLDPAVNQQLADGMRDVVERFGGGDLAGANNKLNALFQLVR